MTRQIAAAILLTVWAMLIAGGVVAYFTTRSVLLADLDATLMSNALSQAVQTRVPTTEPTAEPSQVYLGGNRYLVKNDLKQTIARPGVGLPELKPMAQRLNEMLARLQEAFSLRNQFIGDASHELRTPVAALVTTLDVALRHPRDGEAYRRILESCRGDARQLKHLVERLMEQI